MIHSSYDEYTHLNTTQPDPAAGAIHAKWTKLLGRLSVANNTLKQFMSKSI